MIYMRLLVLFLTLAALPVVFGQSGRAISTPLPTAGSGQIKPMFDEVNGYIKAKAAEFDAKKRPFSERLLEQVKIEQKQLAARYASTTDTRTDLAGDDLYYLGMLHWIAGNYDGTARVLRKYIDDKDAAADRRQTARSIFVVVAAKQKKLDDAERGLAEYLKAEPTKITERARMESELAKAYQEQNDLARMSPHAEEAYKAAKSVLLESSSRARGLDEILDAGMLVFESYRDQGDQKKADDALDDMRVTAASLQASAFYYYAVDQKIRYMIDTGRKPQALEFYTASLAAAARDLKTPSQQSDAISRLKKRERHYKLLGEPAPEIPATDKWFPGAPRTLAGLKGKVVLLDFWATWCGPCIEAFPSLREWQQDYAQEGLVILGLTRFYGNAEGAPADAGAELEYLKKYRVSQKLNYDFVVASDQSGQMTYGATSLPTTVLIDRHGRVRYIETGTSTERLGQIRDMIAKLIKEK